ncbi:hypothetical protein [Azospirillum rugosum]|uniref:Transposase n=1 Tax=Azospirillum rugosum TaxID=416170 RepID=A0ABS4SUH2_9PROT|nr:hypothetical protein [Azospirillum rugosum]MBP2295030.1 hypothetical protein [Azospirillum rugosum]MDQ0528853.1 hypothetical protein [Azospirillum rugosum]
MIEKLPEMSDADLGVLMSNAERLVQTGTPKQQTAAQAMLPAIQAEALRRRDLKPAKRAPRGGRKAAVSPA